jgi:hypothetical protein
MIGQDSMTYAAYSRLEFYFEALWFMIIFIFISVFVLGFVLMVGILSVIRGLYAFSVYQPPLLSSDPSPNHSSDEEPERLDEVSCRQPRSWDNAAVP